jgi:predicted dehydrogenase
MQLWGPEGYAEVDFASRRLTLVQPSEEVRRHGLDPARLDPASRSRIREELFTRHLEIATIDGKAQDQLTCELQDFVTCVQTGKSPRVSGKDALAAIDVAERILRSLRAHRWDERATSGVMFPHPGQQGAA